MDFRPITRAVITLASILLPACIWGEIPAGYYDKAAGLTTSELKTALYNIISNHSSVGYSSLPTYFKKTDVKPGTEFWWDMYSDMNININQTFGNYMNREHSFPKSWWGGSTSVKAYTDLFHLYPSEANANQAKSNYPLGVVKEIPPYSTQAKAPFNNGVCYVGKGIESGGAPYVFEPNDEYKGDFARSYFYVVTCYQNLKWASQYMWMVRDGAYPTLQNWAISLLLDWSRKDPVSEKEKNRNEAVYAIQNNRNPFIDYPELAEYIWGNKMGETFTPGTVTPPDPGNEPELIAPVSGTVLEFEEIACDRTTSSSLYFKGQNLTGELELTVVGASAKYFKLEQSTLSAAAVNSESGLWLNVTFTPDAPGDYEATLVVQDGGLTGSISIPLLARALAVPVLPAPVALEATDVTDYGYTARWEQPETGTAPDYYVVTLRRYSGGSFLTSEIIAETDSLVIDQFDSYDHDTYTVQSCALGHRSDYSATITVSHPTGISSIADQAPIAVESFEGGLVRVTCGEAHRAFKVIDSMGRIIKSLPVIESGTEFTLPTGVYLITTASHPSPIRLVINP